MPAARAARYLTLAGLAAGAAAAAHGGWGEVSDPRWAGAAVLGAALAAIGLAWTGIAAAAARWASASSGMNRATAAATRRSTSEGRSLCANGATWAST